MKKTRKVLKVSFRMGVFVLVFFLSCSTLCVYSNVFANSVTDLQIDTADAMLISSDSLDVMATSSYNNGVISVSDTDIVLSINGTVNIAYSFYQTGYTVTIYYEGGHLVNNTVTNTQISITGVHPGKTALMLYYSKRNGSTIIDEGAVIIDIIVRPVEGYVYLKNIHNGRYADVAGGKAKEGASVIMWGKHVPYSANQIWKIIPNNEGTCTIRSELGNGYYLSRNINTNRLEISTSPSYWIIQYDTINENYLILSPTGTYRICIEGDTTTSNAYLCCSTAANSTSRRWLIQYQTSYVPISSISLVSPSSSAITMCVGDVLNLTTQTTPSNASCTGYTLSTTNSNIVYSETSSRIVAKEPGTATVTVTTVAGGKIDTLTVTVVSAPTVSHQGSVYLGLVSENYANGCSYGERNSSTYASDFKRFLCASQMYNSKTVALERTSNADKRLFLQESDGGFANNVEDVDFMIYIGHGTGNKLHFLSSPDGATHFHGADDEKFEFSYTEAKFGESGGRIKWVFAYTCNFLSVGNGYVSNVSELYPMLEGAHIILGGGTGMVLNSNMALAFSSKLNQGLPIIDSYLDTLSGQTGYYTEPVIFRAIYALEARNDTLFEYARDVKGYSEGERYSNISLTYTP